MSAENQYSFLRRLFIYQKERFPLLGHGILIFAFTFSAVAYSRMCQGLETFISWGMFLPGVFTTVTLFFLLRVFDEHKDKEDDLKYRTYLPVPRGLMSLRELRTVGFLIAVIQLVVVFVFHPTMIWFWLLVIGYLLLMGVEFFVPKWLKQRQVLYITSHMVIIPLVDLYASGLDWWLAGSKPHIGLLFFFGVSYMNGIVLELGRKMKAPEKEEAGVVSYTGLYGVVGGPVRWMIVLTVTLCLAVLAAWYAGHSWPVYLALGLAYALCVLVGFGFIRTKNAKWGKRIEHISGIWALTMYLGLGGIPMLQGLIMS